MIDEINDKSVIVIPACDIRSLKQQIPPRIAMEIFLFMYPTCNLIALMINRIRR